jgi:hypothetical protein
MSAAENEQSMDATRDKVQNWLMSEGWQIAEQAHPDLAWLIRAEDAAERRILVGQNKARRDQIHLEARVNTFLGIKDVRTSGIYDSGS